LSSQRPLPNASVLALGYFTTCAVIGILGGSFSSWELESMGDGVSAAIEALT
jgi:hypothetical protein